VLVSRWDRPHTPITQNGAIIAFPRGLISSSDTEVAQRDDLYGYADKHFDHSAIKVEVEQQVVRTVHGRPSGEWAAPVVFFIPSPSPSRYQRPATALCQPRFELNRQLNGPDYHCRQFNKTN